MARRTLAQTRALLLDTGLAMLEQRGVGAGVTHIRLKEVAETAGLTTGAGYRCWDDQPAFHRDLAIAAVARGEDEPITETVAAIRDAVDRGAPLAEVIRVAAEANLYHFPEKTTLLNTITLRTCGPSDEELARAGREHLTRTVESYAMLHATLLARYRLRVRPPYTITDLTLALIALTDGFAVQAMTGEPHARIERRDVAPGVGCDWTLFACAVEAVVARFVCDF